MLRFKSTYQAKLFLTDIEASDVLILMIIAKRVGNYMKQLSYDKF